MAKRPTLESPFAKTDHAPTGASGSATNEVPAEGRTLPTAVGMKESEIEALDELAAELGIARNALMRWLIRWGLKEYRAGRVPLAKSIRTKTQTTIEMP